jgi:hypothetical protein
VGKYCTAGQAIDGNMAHCVLDNKSYKHTEYVIFIAFPLQQWWHERASLLRYKYTACLLLIVL